MAVESLKEQRAIIVDIDQKQLAIVVDEVTEVKCLTNNVVDPLETLNVRNECIHGVVQDGDRLLILLGAGKLTDEKEDSCIEICG